MTKAFGYLRVSGRDQIDGDGFPRQRAAITAWAKAHNYRIVQWFEEKAVCGDTEWEKRAAWSDMVATFNGINVVIVESFQRLARELFIQEHILRDLKKRNVELFSAHEHDLAGGIDPTRVLVRQIIGAVAQYDRAMINLKLAGARKRMKAKTGRCEGQKPYGDMPTEAEALKLMRDARAAGHTFDNVAVLMNQSEHRTRKGGLWLGATVCKILRRAK